MAHSQREKALQYLLGELPERNAVEFEEQCFADDNLFEETCALENDLLDSFIQGELSQAQRHQFEKGYLVSPARRANLEFSRLLAEHISAAKPRVAAAKPSSAPAFLFFQPWPRRLAWMSLLAFAIAGVSCLLVVDRRLRYEIDSMSARQAEFQYQEQNLHQELLQLETMLHPNTVAQQMPSPRIISLFLMPGSNRSGGDTHKIVITSGAPLVQVHLYLDHDEYSSYRAFLNDANGRQIWGNHSELKSHAGAQKSRIVIVRMTSSILRSGDYLVKLQGKAANGDFEEVEDYQFQVVRR
ncbi:MAG TPA: hypothetical protein VK699_21395 [Terriglobales bacterium]|jgi:hypothetical protein|nr:hypothetical protein [Terriglobales bacterium]